MKTVYSLNALLFFLLLFGEMSQSCFVSTEDPSVFDTVNVQFLQCPHMFVFDSKSGSCVCSPSLREFAETCKKWKTESLGVVALTSWHFPNHFSLSCGWMGSVKNRNGEKRFQYSSSCPIEKLQL